MLINNNFLVIYLYLEHQHSQNSDNMMDFSGGNSSINKEDSRYNLFNFVYIIRILENRRSSNIIAMEIDSGNLNLSGNNPKGY